MISSIYLLAENDKMHNGEHSCIYKKNEELYEKLIRAEVGRGRKHT